LSFIDYCLSFEHRLIHNFCMFCVCQSFNREATNLLTYLFLRRLFTAKTLWRLTCITVNWNPKRYRKKKHMMFSHFSVSMLNTGDQFFELFWRFVFFFFSARACTSCRPLLITIKEKGVVAELLDTVAKHRFV